MLYDLVNIECSALSRVDGEISILLIKLGGCGGGIPCDFPNRDTIKGIPELHRMLSRTFHDVHSTGDRLQDDNPTKTVYIVNLYFAPDLFPGDEGEQLFPI